MWRPGFPAGRSYSGEKFLNLSGHVYSAAVVTLLVPIVERDLFRGELWQHCNPANRFEII